MLDSRIERCLDAATAMFKVGTKFLEAENKRRDELTKKWRDALEAAMKKLGEVS